MFNHPVAFIVFFGMLPLSLYIFRRNSPATATAIVVLSGSLFLPERYGIDIPVVPLIDKERITYLAALLGILVYQRKVFWDSRPGFGLEALLLLMIAARIPTMFMNTQPVMNIGELQPGVGFYWLITNSVDDFLTYILPFLVGRTIFKTEQDLRVLLYTLVGFGLIYAFLIAVEVFMSIPFHVWHLSQVIYGIPMRPLFRYGFTQPNVFMDNGLAVASFMALSVIAAAAFAKSKIYESWSGVRRVRPILLSGLLMTFNVAGNVYGFAVSAAFSLFGKKNLCRMAVMLAILPCVYPSLRMLDVFPAQAIVDYAATKDPERARSLQGRFDEEDFVFEHIGDRFWVGWAMYDRIPDAAVFGQGETGLDSWWIITAGITGLIGVIIRFLLLAIPIFVAARRLKSLVNSPSAYFLLALMFCVAVRMNDLLINGWFNSLPAFLAGALYGISKAIPKDQNGRPGQRPSPASRNVRPM